MKNREERPTNSDRGATQQTFDFGNEAEAMLPADFLRQEVTDPASDDTPSLSVSPDADLLEQIVDPENLARAWRRVKRNRGAPGPDGMTIHEFESWCPEHWPVIRQQLLDGTYRPAPVRRKTIPKNGDGERRLGIPNVLDRLIQQAICQVLTPIFDPGFSSVQRYLTRVLKLVVNEEKSSVRLSRDCEYLGFASSTHEGEEPCASGGESRLRDQACD